MLQSTTWSHERKCVTPSLYFPRDALSVGSNGILWALPATHKAVWAKHTLVPSKAVAGFQAEDDSINNSRLGLISVDLMLRHSTPRVMFVAHPLPQLKATHETTDRNTLLGVSREGSMSASPALLHSATPYTCLNCLQGLFPTSPTSEGPQANQGNGQEKIEKCNERRYIPILKCEFPFGSEHFFASFQSAL